MDRAKLSDESIEDLGRVFVSVLKRNAAELVEGDLDTIERHVQAMGRNILGPVVQQVVRGIGAAGPDERSVCAGCKRPMRPVDYQRPRELVGLVGDYGL